jgi:aryl-alcohol dehydrogenase-like predicted oxidoreductase
MEHFSGFSIIEMFGLGHHSIVERRSFDRDAHVSLLGVGCSRVASINNPVPMREIEATLETAVEAGINLFDTADIYGQGDSERTLSRIQKSVIVNIVMPV